MGNLVPVHITSHLILPSSLPRALKSALKSEFTHSNPDYFKKRNMGYKTFGTPSKLKGFIETDEGALHLPRGGIRKLRDILVEEGYRPRFFDETHTVPVIEYPRFCIDPDDDSKVLRPYQVDAVQAALARKQGIIRAPTGSGKTTIAFALIHAAQQRTIVMVNDSNLAEQWIREASRSLDLDPSEIGVVRGGRKYRPGKRLTVGLVQSLYRKGSNLEKLLDEERFGMVIFDEVQRAAARTFLEVISKFPAKYRIGLSADETRKDGKEFLVYDQFGEVIYEIERTDLEGKGYIHPVNVRMIPTNFEAPWYVTADPAERDWARLLEELIEDEHRNEFVHMAIQFAADEGEFPAVAFSHRREHATALAEEIYARGRPCGLMMGGNATDKALFEEARDRIVAGELDIATGTFNALGTGINMPAICAGICTTPIGKNRQYFGQVRGRTCRLAPGKERATLYYLWDRYVFPDTVRRFMSWNDGRVEVLNDSGQWVKGSDFTF